MVSLKLKEFIPAKACRIKGVNCLYACVDLDWIFRGKLCKVKINKVEWKTNMFINQPLEDIKKEVGGTSILLCPVVPQFQFLGLLGKCPW